MRTTRSWLAVLVLLTQILGSLPTLADDDRDSTDIGWPREVKAEGTQLTLYQPQVEYWENNHLKGRAAIALNSSGTAQPTYGVVWISARTEIDKESHLVNLVDVQITDSNLPTAGAREADYKAFLQKHLPEIPLTLALDRLQANLAITKLESNTTAVKLKNDAPKIYFSKTPSTLVLIDGKPVLRKVENSDFFRVVNTRALLLFDEGNNSYFLRVRERWMTAKNLEGPWNVPKEITAKLEIARKAVLDAQSADAITDKDTPDDARTFPSAIFVSLVPAELIETQGEPNWSPVSGTNLLYVNNTSANLFLDPSDQTYFALISGRWFRTKNLTGNWNYVAPKDLPAQFAQISPEHPKGDVLASIPNTPQAEEALIENSIPQTATVDRQQAKAVVVYDGGPQFQPIAGTPLFYAVNSPVPVIRVDQNTYYSVQNGVWFIATAANGPWVVASSVPTVIYTIPPSSPLHYVTYVKIYEATPQVVYVGYTPGYFGSCVSPEHVVVYGTGWNYTPYVGAYWVGFPITYGFRARFHWSVWTGWGFGFGFAPVYWPWWGPFSWGWYGPRYYGGHGDHFTHNVTINNNIYNVHTVNVYNRWQRNTVVHTSSPRTSLQAHVPHTNPPISWIAGQKNHNNVFAGKDGHVYRREGKSWEQPQGRKWEKVTTQAPGTSTTPAVKTNTSTRQALPQTVHSQLEHEHQARELGQKRWDFFQKSAGHSKATGGFVRSSGKGKH